jgi:hypothetical protein
MGRSAEPYQIEYPQHVQMELQARNEKAIVVADGSNFQIGLDMIWPYVAGPFFGFIGLCFFLGFSMIAKKTLMNFGVIKKPPS